MEIRWRNRAINPESGALMGILNVTPDSFSDGSRFADAQTAIEQAGAMAAAGAVFIDIGGESTRPGAAAVPVEIESARVLPVIEALAELRAQGKFDALISIDTRKPAVARAALQSGADLVNDVTGLRDPAMRDVCAEFGVPAVLMHMRGTPETLRWSQEAQPFNDVVSEVRDELSELAAGALAAGVPSVILDPGFGFGKSLEQNLELIRRLGEIKKLGHPVLLGASRKSTLGRITGVPVAAERDPASIAAHLYGLMQGADILRVHDVAGHAQAIKVWQRLWSR
ncbi:MAG TPA: dihydropteroate synthase [Blastocatellia bacterium]|nr:dihydropteroate synthase [Blastocatellia bacterium]